MPIDQAPAASVANPTRWTLRDEIAMRVLVNLMHPDMDWRISVAGDDPVPEPPKLSGADDYAKAAYLFADAMLTARGD